MNSTIKAAPPKADLSTDSSPNMRLVADFAIANPSPKPPVFRLRLLSIRTNGKKNSIVKFFGNTRAIVFNR